ncbi:MAG: BrnT family toxin [Sulfuricella sp.]
MGLVISKGVEEKLSKKVPPVSLREIEQCFENREHGLLLDEREKNKSDPPTQWFIALTNQNRLLKIVFIQKNGDVTIRTAYEPNPEEIRIYKKYA